MVAYSILPERKDTFITTLKLIEMMKTRPEVQPITMVYDMPSVLPPGTTPVSRLYYEDWNIKVVDREKTGCDNYLTPNRRDFYKIMFMTSGTGMKTMGKENYFIDERTILFLHPNEIVCWRNASPTVGGGIFCMFKKRYLDQHPSLKLIIDRYRFFTEKKILRLSEESAWMVHSLLTQMKAEAASGDPRVLTQLISDDFLSRLVCRQFAKTCQFIAYEKVDQSEDSITKAFDQIQVYLSEVARQILLRIWDYWQRPPYSVHLVNLKAQISWFRAQKIKIEILGPPIHLSELGFTKEAHISVLEDQIKIGEAVSSFLVDAIEQGQNLPDNFGPERNADTEEVHETKVTKSQEGKLKRYEQYRSDVANFQLLDGKNQVDAIKAAAKKNLVHINTIDRAMGFRK